MTNKIITTFETTLTWTCPTEQLPDTDRNVLIKLKEYDKSINQVILYRDDNDQELYFSNSDNSFEIDEVQWWAYCPNFG